MLRKLAVSYWAVGLFAIAMAVLHVWWLLQTDHAGEVLSGLGAMLQAIGLLVAAGPFIRTGLRGMAEQQVQAPQPPYLDDNEYSITRAAQTAYKAKIKAALPDVWAERVVAVVVIALGTLLNGYGTPIARLLGMRI